MNRKKTGTPASISAQQALTSLLDEEPDRPDRIFDLVKDNLTDILKLKKQRYSYRQIAAALSKASKSDVKEATLRTYTGRLVRESMAVGTRRLRPAKSPMPQPVSGEKSTEKRAPVSCPFNEVFKTTAPNDQDY